MYSSPTEILAALDRYRSHIAAKNRAALEIYVPFIMNAEEPEDGDFDDDFDAGELRMEAIKQLIGDDIILDREGISTPAGLLERYDDLCPQLGFDGTFVADAKNRASKRDGYFSTIYETLRERCITEVRNAISIPEELTSLAEHVDGLLGSGLDHYRSKFQFAAWWGPTEDCETYKARVKTPDELMKWLGLVEWNIGGGWDLGKGPDASLYAVYCRKLEDDVWSWRYVLSREYGRDVFERLTEVLDWHSHYRQQDISKVPEFDKADMWDLML